jgi:hypothetical protein
MAVMNTKSAKKEFVDAIRDKKRVKVIYYSQEQKRFLVKVCAPIDYGMDAGVAATTSGAERLRFWDLEQQDQVRSLNVLDEFFDPSELVAGQASSTGRHYS